MGILPLHNNWNGTDYSRLLPLQISPCGSWSLEEEVLKEIFQGRFNLVYPWCTIFDRKGILSYIFYWQMVPLLHTSSQHCIPFNCCKCTVFYIRKNHKSNHKVFLPFSHPKDVLTKVGPFTDRNDRLPYPLIHFKYWDPPPPSHSSVRMPELHANLKMVYITGEHFWRCHPQYEHN